MDGYLARRLDQTSRFGAFLDPVADKLLVAVALVLLVQADPRAWLAITAAIIIGREIAVSALREFMAEIGPRSQVQVAAGGQVQTVAREGAGGWRRDGGGEQVDRRGRAADVEGGAEAVGERDKGGFDGLPLRVGHAGR